MDEEHFTKYFSAYAHGKGDIEETLKLFADVMEGAVIPELRVDELTEIKNLFLGEPKRFLENVQRVFSESEDEVEVAIMAKMLSDLKRRMQKYAEGKPEKEPLRDRILSVLILCTGKLSLILTHKGVVIKLNKKPDQRSGF